MSKPQATAFLAAVALDALRAALPSLGLRVVPAKPTREMEMAAFRWIWRFDLTYDAALSAAPDVLGEAT